MAAIPIRDEPIPGKPGLTPLDPGGPKLIVHTTEVGVEWEDNGAPGLIQRCRNRDLTAFAAIYNGVLATWKRGSGLPTQYLVDAPNRVAARCVPDNVGSYALEDLAGGVRTNRAGTRLIQMEIVGHAAQLTQEFDAATWAWLGDLLRQICAANGIPYTYPAPFATSPAPAYGINAPQRLTAAAYVATAGIIGHQHVPENVHSDPGAFPLANATNPTPGDDTMERRVLRFTHKPDDLWVGDIQWAADGSPVPWLVENISIDQWNFYGATLGPIIDVDPARISPCVCIGPTPEGAIPTGTWPFHRVLSGAAHSHPELAGANHAHTNLAPVTHTHPAQPPAAHTHAELAPATHVHTVPAHTHPAQPAAPHTHPLTGNTGQSA